MAALNDLERLEKCQDLLPRLLSVCEALYAATAESGVNLELWDLSALQEARTFVHEKEKI